MPPKDYNFLDELVNGKITAELQSNLKFTGDLLAIDGGTSWYKQVVPIDMGVIVYLVRQPNLKIECFRNIPTQTSAGVWVGEKMDFIIDENRFDCSNIDNLTYKEANVYFSF